MVGECAGRGAAAVLLLRGEADVLGWLAGWLLLLAGWPGGLEQQRLESYCSGRIGTALASLR